MSIFTQLTTAARKRAEYARTLNELSRMSDATAADLGIDGRDMREVAYKAVYGG